MSAQLNLLEPEMFNAEEAYRKIEQTCTNVRRGIFARLNSHKHEVGCLILNLIKKIDELEQEVQILKNRK